MCMGGGLACCTCLQEGRLLGICHVTWYQVCLDPTGSLLLWAGHTFAMHGVHLRLCIIIQEVGLWHAVEVVHCGAGTYTAWADSVRIVHHTKERVRNSTVCTCLQTGAAALEVRSLAQSGRMAVLFGRSMVLKRRYDN